jgi:hypothetical protein
MKAEAEDGAVLITGLMGYAIISNAHLVFSGALDLLF